MRVDAVEREADDPGAVFGPEQSDAGELARARSRFGDQRALMGVDRVEADAFDVQSIAAWKPIAPAMCGVPASNRDGRGA